MTRRLLAGLSGLLLSLPTLADEELREQASALLGQLSPVTADELEDPRVVLGQALFWDMRLSRDGKTACASCHLPEAGGSDPRPLSVTARGGKTGMHSMTVFNTQQAEAGLRWFGDRASGAEQAIGSITGSMGFDDHGHFLEALGAAGYDEAFQAVWPDEPETLSVEKYGEALEAYQRSLRTPAAFDAWLAGDDSALDGKALAGLGHFLRDGCVGCHNGPLLGGRSLQVFQGERYRVPTLRQVSQTAPYLHDGSVDELDEMIALMAREQLGRSDYDEERTAAVQAFLMSLEGELPVNFHAPEGVPFSPPADDQSS